MNALLAIQCRACGAAFFCATALLQTATSQVALDSSQSLVRGGRIDAISSLGSGILIAGSRHPTPGLVFRSTDCGRTWCQLVKLIGGDGQSKNVTCIACSDKGLAYLLTGDSYVWKSRDWGRNWRALGQVSRSMAFGNYQGSYGLAVLDSGTILVSNTDPVGGHIFRSENGGRSWQDLGPQSDGPLYRFEKLPHAVLVNGWSGHVYKSTNDGRTWQDQGRLCQSALFATEYLKDGIALQGAEDGRIFRSADFGSTWNQVAKFPESADDFAYLGNGQVIYATYSGSKYVYQSLDDGRSWKRFGSIPSAGQADSLDHVVSVKCDGRIIGVGGTMLGNIVTFR